MRAHRRLTSIAAALGPAGGSCVGSAAASRGDASSAAPDQLIATAAETEHYRTHGWVVCRGVLPATLTDTVRGVLGAWCDRTIDSWVDEGLLEDAAPELDMRNRLRECWQRAGEPQYSRSPRRDLVSPQMFEILADATLAALSRQLMGCAEVLSHSIFNARPKLPQQSWTDTPWHQDAQYYPDAGQPGNGHHVLSLWIPTQPVSERNSCMEVAPLPHLGNNRP